VLAQAFPGPRAESQYRYVRPDAYCPSASVAKAPPSGVPSAAFLVISDTGIGTFFDTVQFKPVVPGAETRKDGWSEP